MHCPCMTKGKDSLAILQNIILKSLMLQGGLGHFKHLNRHTLQDGTILLLLQYYYYYSSSSSSSITCRVRIYRSSQICHIHTVWYWGFKETTYGVEKFFLNDE